MKINSIYCGDCAKVLSEFPDNSIDMVFVDPPYGKDGIYLYEVIAKEAARLLKPDKFAVFYASDYWFPKTFNGCLEYLDFFYLFHLEMPGQNALIFPRNIIARYKTLMVFSKGKPKAIKRVHNCVISPERKTGELHKWQQSEWPAIYMIQAFSNENDIVLDPNVGSGTTCVAAKQLNRNYIGIEISEEYCAVAQERLNA